MFRAMSKIIEGISRSMGSAANGSRSSVLKPYMSLIALLGSFLSVSLFREDLIVRYALLCLIIFIVIAVSVKYHYFSITKPDYLWSEDYNLRKLAIESGLTGDTDNPALKNECLEDIPKAKAETTQPQNAQEDIK